MSSEQPEVHNVSVIVDEQAREVAFSGSKQDLVSAVREKFADTIREDENICLQTWDDESGAFVDLTDTTLSDFPPGSRVRVIVSGWTKM